MALISSPPPVTVRTVKAPEVRSASIGGLGVQQRVVPLTPADSPLALVSSGGAGNRGSATQPVTAYTVAPRLATAAASATTAEGSAVSIVTVPRAATAAPAVVAMPAQSPLQAVRAPQPASSLNVSSKVPDEGNGCSNPVDAGSSQAATSASTPAAAAVAPVAEAPVPRKAPAAATEGLVPRGLEPTTAQDHRFFGGAGEEYRLEEVLGEGSYGSVYRCLRVRDEAVFAAKIIDTLRIGFVGGQAGVKAAQVMAAREVEALRQLSVHPAVISLEAAFFSERTQQVFIVTEFVPGSHLFSHVVQRSEPLKEPTASHIAAQLSDAVSFCHALGVVHRDLKLENVLVASIDVHLMEQKQPGTGVVMWETIELFSVKICDFGFAKSLQAYTTRTHVGTGQYAAPELNVEAGQTSLGQAPSGEHRASDEPADNTAARNYDAFKADAFSFGVMLFVMLCLGFPPKNRGKNKHSHRDHKHWPKLSFGASALIDGLLDVDPAKRLSIIDVCNHPWVKMAPLDHGEDIVELTRSKSKESFLSSANAEVDWERCTSLQRQRTPQPKWFSDTDHQNAALPGVLALHRALVHVQQERAMACWALSGSAGLDGISCWDQLQWHIQLTEKRMHEAKVLLDKGRRPDSPAGAGDSPLSTHSGVSVGQPVDKLFSLLTRARKLALASQQPSSGSSQSWSGESAVDEIYVTYNEACSSLIEVNAHTLENSACGSANARRAAQRYRLFAAAAEQLGRERAFISWKEEREGPPPRSGPTPSASSSAPAPRAAAEAGAAASAEAARSLRAWSPNRLQRLAEILGARKILLGTTLGDNSSVVAGDVATTSTGLLGTLLGEDEPLLFAPEDVAKLEALEQRVLAPQASDAAPPTEEWYQTITRLLNELHSRIAIFLLDDMRLPELDAPKCEPISLDAKLGGANAGAATSRRPGGGPEDRGAGGGCGCRAGLKRFLQAAADRL